MSQFKKIEERTLEDFHGQGYLYEHSTTGAKLIHIACDDDNKSFMVSFRTLPESNNGIAHILEHSVLCGSKKFPVKEPFVDLLRSSVNTFLNAMTFSDKTVYPVASRNLRDLENLMDVYLDAVFHPLLHEDELILKQEGWHYEIHDDELSVNGVVYNEMRGALSSPDMALGNEADKIFYPGSQYGFNSGGDPAAILDLDQDEFVAFHKRNYHPSNAIFLLYGDMPIEPMLERIDAALAGFERLEDLPQLRLSPNPETPIRFRMPFAPGQEETGGNPALLCYRANPRSDEEATLALPILAYALCGPDSAPLKHAIMETGYVEDMSLSYRNFLNPCNLLFNFYGVLPQDEELLFEKIYTALEEICKTGFSQKLLDAIFSKISFSIREADNGGMPRGLVHGISAIGDLHDGLSPFTAFELSKQLEQVRELCNSDYLVELTRRYILDNQAYIYATIEADGQYYAKREAAERERLDAIYTQMTEADKAEIEQICEGLKQRRETPDAPEAAASIPHLELSDLPEAPEILDLEHDGESRVFLEGLCSGIWYQDFNFIVNDIEDRFALAVLTEVLGRLSSDRRNRHEIDLDTMIDFGRFNSSINVRNGQTYFQIETSFLVEKVDDALALLREILLDSQYTDHHEYVLPFTQLYAQYQMMALNNGHRIAIDEVQSSCGEDEALLRELSGIPFFDGIDEIIETNDYAQIAKRVANVAKQVFVSSRLLQNSCGERENKETIYAKLEAFKKSLPTGELNDPLLMPELNSTRSAYMIPSEVQYVALGGHLSNIGLPWSGKLLVLTKLLDRSYLWNEIRVGGGAYGCICWAQRSGQIGFVSYRDPKLKQTLDVFATIPDFIEQIELSDRELLDLKIACLGDYLSQRSDYQKMQLEIQYEQLGFSHEDRIAEWNDIISTSLEDLRAYAPYYRQLIDAQHFTVVGSPEMINRHQELFDSGRMLLSEGSFYMDEMDAVDELDELNE
ncbi:MAG: insulinase family protein [Eubacteriales bacterium]|nr:insulinase family protein [Eubacteriales bacterium]